MKPKILIVIADYYKHISTDLLKSAVSHVDKKSNVVSLIGVFEHLEKPDKFIKSFLKSNIDYLYIAVPLVSLSMFLENVFLNVSPRHLSGDHTHLYTKESLNYLAKKNNLKIVGEWWFGSDLMDLLRDGLVSLSQNTCSETFIDK